MCRCRQDKAQQAEVAEQLEKECDWLEENADAAGPFFMGTAFSLVVRTVHAALILLVLLTLASWCKRIQVTKVAWPHIWKGVEAVTRRTHRHTMTCSLHAGLCSGSLVCPQLHHRALQATAAAAPALH